MTSHAANADTPDIHRALSNPARRRILTLLDAHPEGLTLDEFSVDVDRHRSTVRAHLRILIDAGLVTSQPEATPGRGRPRHRYALGQAPKVQSSGYRLLAEILVGNLASAADPAIEAERAGRAWGAYLVDEPSPGTVTTAPEATTQLLAMFDGLGFAPTAPTVGEIHLHECPFADLAKVHEAVVCPLHRGLVTGALDRLRAPLVAGELQPWVEPSLCVLHLDAA